VAHRLEPDFSWVASDDRAILSGSGLQVSFARIGDGWTHALELPPEHVSAVARAVESDPERDHPARVVSPLYQELHRHELLPGPGLCVLLTGRLFQHHFSAAVYLRMDPAADECLVLDFDVADRCRAPVESLAATYLVRLDSGALQDADPHRIVWDPPGQVRSRLELIAEPPHTLALAEAGRQAARVQVLATLVPGTFTQRLRYRWRWTTLSDRTR
jgi:hypothetical protein